MSTEISKEKDWVSTVIIIGPNGEIPITQKILHESPQWKLIGGGKEFFERFPEQTAIREVCEETGLTIQKARLKLLRIYNLPGHYRFLYSIYVSDFANFRHNTANEQGEIAKISSREEISCMSDFLPEHQNLLSDFDHMEKVDALAFSHLEDEDISSAVALCKEVSLAMFAKITHRCCIEAQNKLSKDISALGSIQNNIPESTIATLQKLAHFAES